MSIKLLDNYLKFPLVSHVAMEWSKTDRITPGVAVHKSMIPGDSCAAVENSLRFPLH